MTKQGLMIKMSILGMVASMHQTAEYTMSIVQLICINLYLGLDLPY